MHSSAYQRSDASLAKLARDSRPVVTRVRMAAGASAELFASLEDAPALRKQARRLPGCRLATLGLSTPPVAQLASHADAAGELRARSATLAKARPQRSSFPPFADTPQAARRYSEALRAGAEARRAFAAALCAFQGAREGEEVSARGASPASGSHARCAWGPS